MDLNRRAADLLDRLAPQSDALRIVPQRRPDGATVWDFGVACLGGLEAGRRLAEICLADLGTVELVPARPGLAAAVEVRVSVDRPIEACLASQYAGRRIQVGKFFAMGSGPMRAAAPREPLFEHLPGHEAWGAKAGVAVGVLESSKLPGDDVIAHIAELVGLPPAGVRLAVAPVTSLAGTVQVVARSVETCLHKLHELGFPPAAVVSGFGSAPLPPPGADMLTAMGRTNDAILYGGETTLWVRTDDALLEELGPRTPSLSSADYGLPFAETFRRADCDFYKIDPLLFSPAVVRFVNLTSGKTFVYGKLNPEVLATSFGV